MLVGIAVISFSLLYTIMVAIVYFSKKKLKNVENGIYSLLLGISIVGLVLELLCCFTTYYYETSTLLNLINEITNKTYLIYLLSWEMLFTIYMYLISYLQNEEEKKKLKEIKKKGLPLVLTLYVVLALLVIKIPLYYHNDVYVYSYGPGTDLLSVLGGLFIIFDFYCLFKNIKYINKKKYYPLFVLVFLMVFVLTIRSINPGLIIINSVFAFVTVMMYFTIENPDVQMLEELYKARDYAEKTNNEKSIFLFNITQQIREPLRSINRFSKEALMEDNMDIVKSYLRDIKYSSNSSLALVNDVLDISDLENRKIVINEHKYQLQNLIKSIVKLTKNKIQEKEIDFRFNYDESIPEQLEGDSLRLKQILLTLLDNAVEYTESGFIEFSVNCVIKHDICRLIMTIEDSGKGMQADEIKHLFEKTSNIEINEIDDSQQNLIFVKTLIDLIGGTVTVNSEIEKGSKFMVVVDQKIPTDKKNQITKAVDQYKKMYVDFEHVLLVCADEKVKQKMSLLLKKLHVTYDVVLTGQECLEKIRNHETYQVIIMDEELPKLSSLHTFEKLKMIEDFDTPVVIMTEHKDISAKDVLIKQGFQDTITIPINKEEVKHILEKYIDI